MDYDFTNADREGTYDRTDWRVKILGERDGFTYVEFLTGPQRGVTTKVPSTWVTMDEPAETSR